MVLAPMVSLVEKPPTGEPDAGNPPVRFGGRGGAKAPSLPLSMDAVRFKMIDMLDMDREKMMVSVSSTSGFLKI
jgi:hypothetical protein